MSSKYLFEWWANDNTSQARSGQNSSQNQSYSKEVNGLFSIVQRVFPINPTKIKDGKFTLIFGAENKRKWHNQGVSVSSATDPYISIIGLNKDSFVPGAIRTQSYKHPNYYFLGNTNLSRKYADTAFIVLRANLVGLTSYNSNAFSFFVNGQKEVMGFSSFNAPIENGFMTSVTTFGYMALFHNDWIPDNEINELYKEFLNLKPKQKTIYPLNIAKPTSLQETGLVAAYNLKPVNGKLPNIALPNPANVNNPYQYDGTVSKCQSIDKGLYFNGKGFINIPTLTLNGSKFVWCGVFQTLQSGVNCNFGNGTSPTNGFLIGVFTDNRFYIQFPGEIIYASTSIQAGFHTFVAVYDGTQSTNETKCILYLDGIKKILLFSNSIPSSVNTTGWKIGSAMGGYLSSFCKIFDHRIYNRILSEKEIKDYHNLFVSKPVLKEDFFQYTVNSKPNNWRIKSGTWKIGEYADKSNYLECLTAGVIGIPSKNAYGIWEFDFYRGGAGNTLFINFIANTLAGAIVPVGYQIFLTDQVRFVRLNGGTDNTISNTPLNYISTKVKYSFRLTRRTDGVIEFYIKGGTFGNEYRIVPKTLQGGFIPINDNTNKSSNYFVLDLDAGDRFSNLKIYQGITV